MAKSAKVLVLGNGGREHALILELSQDPSKPRLYGVDGNAGMQKSGALMLKPQITGLEGILAAAHAEKITFIISGPERPLVEESIVERAWSWDILALGPYQKAARITEGKKSSGQEIYASA